MKRPYLLLAGAAFIVVTLMGCQKKQEGNPVSPDDSKYASPKMGTSAAPGGAQSGSGTNTTTAKPTTD